VVVLVSVAEGCTVAVSVAVRVAVEVTVAVVVSVTEGCTLGVSVTVMVPVMVPVGVSVNPLGALGALACVALVGRLANALPTNRPTPSRMASIAVMLHMNLRGSLTFI
jgi:hypothetical protein